MKLYELFGYNEEFIMFYKYIIGIENDLIIVKEFIKNYIKIGDFENVICILFLF